MAVAGSPVITDLPIADRMKIIYKDRFLIAEASKAGGISFFINGPERSIIILKNGTQNSEAAVEFRSDLDKRTEGFVVETRPSENGVIPWEFCMKKSEHLQGLEFACRGLIAVRALNEGETEQIEKLKMKHANDRKYCFLDSNQDSNIDLSSRSS